MTLMTLGILLFGTFFPTVGRSIGRAQRKDIATDAAVKQLEFWRNVTYSSLPSIESGKFSTTRTFTGPSDLVTSQGKIVFTRLDASFNPSAVDTNRIRVDVWLSWNAGNFDKGTVKLSTVMTR